ncbi:hypothetical protein GOP47_0020569 [Adiantum capillus-veneris]|uniref:Uncharacterized protein n=1 Tax=Adiantum capillus-veneris TaxID=13818 RepID=A0A9D4UB08_ADICA|nr:hypothetical protein GOP47_0020569 [Adiantum capillus-veneris]
MIPAMASKLPSWSQQLWWCRTGSQAARVSETTSLLAVMPPSCAQEIAKRGVASDYGKTCGVHSRVKDGLVQLLEALVAWLAGCVHCHVKGATGTVHNYGLHIVVNATKLVTGDER